jgi:hypothetical protein
VQCSVQYTLHNTLHTVYKPAPDVETDHNGHGDVEGNHGAEDRHELTCLHKLDETHCLRSVVSLCNAVCSAVQCSAVQCALHCAVQGSVVQCALVLPSVVTMSKLGVPCM